MAHTDDFSGKRVCVLGFARQGRALARWLPTVGASVVVSDSKTAEQLGVKEGDSPGVTFVLGEQTALPEGVDVVCVSGGVPLDNPLVTDALAKNVPLTNDAQLFLERCSAPVIGITGSAGKTTTTTLVGEIVKCAGSTTWIGGNIGDVLLDVLAQIRPDHRVIMELSSFQLELMTASPQIAAVLNITPNHLDRHGTMDAYMNAKAQIIAHQSADDFAVLCRDDAGSLALEGQVIGNLAWFSAREMVADGALMAGQRLVVTGSCSTTGEPQVVCERGDIPLRGDHNVMNVLAACAITGAAGVAPEAMRAAIEAFKPVPHRLEVVRVLSGVTYVNDSIATAPERVVAALRSYSEPLILLAGGKDKNLPWDEMIRLALHKSRHIIAFGHAGDLVVEKVRAISGSEDAVTRVETLEQAVAEAAKVAQPGDVVLLSPGGTSYDAYVDFVARGEHFRKLVLAL
jgi:UDP-N-acetylmuramoylalanine--D-glutamate ligase